MEYGTPLSGTAMSVEKNVPQPDDNGIYHLDTETTLKYLIDRSDEPFTFKGKKSAGYKAIVIKCGASWCRPCVASQPVFADWAKNYKGDDVAFCSLDVDQNDQFSHLFSGVPAWLFIDNQGRLLEDTVLIGAHLPDLAPIKQKVSELVQEANEERLSK